MHLLLSRALTLAAFRAASSMTSSVSLASGSAAMSACIASASEPLSASSSLLTSLLLLLLCATASFLALCCFVTDCLRCCGRRGLGVLGGSPTAAVACSRSDWNMPVSHVQKVTTPQVCSLPLTPSCVCRGAALPAADCRRPERRLDAACLGCGCAWSSLFVADGRRPDRRMDADCLGSGSQSSSTECKLASETSLAAWTSHTQLNVISDLSPSLSSTMRRADCSAAEGFRGCGSLSVHSQDGLVRFLIHACVLSDNPALEQLVPSLSDELQQSMTMSLFDPEQLLILLV